MFYARSAEGAGTPAGALVAPSCEFGHIMKQHLITHWRGMKSHVYTGGLHRSEFCGLKE